MKLKIPPLLFVLLTAGCMELFTRILPGLSLFIPWVSVTVAVLAVTGTLVILLGFIEFRRADTTVDPRYPDRSSSLVTSGIYQYSRNPMYLGMAIWLVAWAVYLEHVLTVPLIFCFVVYMNRYQIKPEEKILKETFGPKYLKYKNSVRRWV